MTSCLTIGINSSNGLIALLVYGTVVCIIKPQNTENIYKNICYHNFLLPWKQCLSNDLNTWKIMFYSHGNKRCFFPVDMDVVCCYGNDVYCCYGGDIFCYHGDEIFCCYDNQSSNCGV